LAGAAFAPAFARPAFASAADVPAVFFVAAFVAAPTAFAGAAGFAAALDCGGVPDAGIFFAAATFFTAAAGLVPAEALAAPVPPAGFGFVFADLATLAPPSMAPAAGFAGPSWGRPACATPRAIPLGHIYGDKRRPCKPHRR
jgi:hypothetical protein